jgi:cobalt-zinc-cadmium efflux system membrane fusion protein
MTHAWHLNERMFGAAACVIGAGLLLAGCDGGTAPRGPTGAPATAPVHGRDHAHGGHEGVQKHDDIHGDDAHHDEVRLSDEAIARYGVRVERAARMTLRPTFMAPARVAFNAEAMAHVGSPLSGRVVELKAKLGDVVAPGDVLLTIESPELGEAQSQYLQRRIAAKTAAAGVELAKNAMDRATKLFEQNRGISLDEVQRRELEYKSAQAAQLTAESAAMAAENTLHLLGMPQAAVAELAATGEVNPRFDIAAPLAGRVVEREVTLGELVSPAKEALLVLADTTTLWVLADVPEARLPEVAIGAKAWLKPGGPASHRHEGEVSYISPMVDPRTRSAQVRIVVHCEHGTLWPGMFAQVEIEATDHEHGVPAGVIAISEEAVQTVEGSPSVFVAAEGEANTFVRRAVVVGKSVHGMTPVHSGLAEGEMYVAAGSFILKAELGKAAAGHSH